MDYKAHYDRLIETRRDLNREKGEQYYEQHHIIPRSEGGTDDESNLILLTAKEHYVAHLLLWKAEPENKSRMYAIWWMGNRTSRFSSRMYESVRQELYGDPFNRKEYTQAYFEQHPGYMEEWYKKNREYSLKHAAGYYQKNKHKWAQAYLDNKKERRKKGKEWYQKNREKILEQRKEYYQKKKEQQARRV